MTFGSDRGDGRALGSGGVLMRIVFFMLALTLLVGLSGCLRSAEIDFTTDVRILRGPWAGTIAAEGDVDDVDLRLELEAEYGDRTQYPFWGQVWFGDEGPFAIEGIAYGRGTEAYVQSTIIPPPRVAGFIAEIPDRSLRICANGAFDIRAYYGWVFEEGTEGVEGVCSGCDHPNCLWDDPLPNFTMRRIEALPLRRSP